jgi:hypothetical protein
MRRAVSSAINQDMIENSQSVAAFACSPKKLRYIV